MSPVEGGIRENNMFVGRKRELNTLYQSDSFEFFSMGEEDASAGIYEGKSGNLLYGCRRYSKGEPAGTICGFFHSNRAMFQ